MSEIDNTTLSVGYDTTFELNEFNEPRIRSELETIKNTLLFVLTSKPGSIPSLPQIGLDISQYLYEFYEDINEEDLKSDIMEQCEVLGNYIASGDIMIKKLMYEDQPSLIIQITGDEVFPDGYRHNNLKNKNQFMIGITYDEFNKMMINVNGK